MNELSLNFATWGIGLLKSQDFWSTIIASLVGGLIALYVARKQVKSSEKQSEHQRKAVVHHERKMELTRIQLQDCRKSIETLSPFLHSLSTLARHTSDLETSISEAEENLDIMGQRSILVLELSGQLLDLESAAKICELKQEDIKKTIELRELTYQLFASLESGTDPEQLKYIIQITPLVNAVRSSFVERQEELIKELQGNLS